MSPPPQVIQVISFTILNDSTFEKMYSREGRRWKQALQTIKQQKGWLRTVYGRDMNSFHKLDIYVAAEAFASTPTFEATLAGIAVSPLSTYYINLEEATLSHQGPVEIVTLSFLPTLFDENRTLFDKQIEHCKPGPLMFHGWTIPSRATSPISSQGCAIIFRWHSLDEMYEVKGDDESLFNNGFVPLKNEASGDSKTVLYTELRDPHYKRPICVVM